MNYNQLFLAIQDTSSDNDDPTFEQNIPNFVNNAERRIYQAVKLPAFRKSVTATVSAGNKYLSTPTDYLAAWELATTSPRYNYLLLKDVAFIREAYPDPNETGTPKYYAQFDDNTFLLGPTPAADSLVELHYFYYPESIVTAGSTWLGNNFENALFYACMIEAATFMKSDEDTMKYYAEQYAVNMKLLQDYASSSIRSGTYR